jgi:hypothetical protein
VTVGAMTFSASQMEALRLAAAPLKPRVRQAFLHAISERLRGCAEIGDGSLQRTIESVQKQFLRAGAMVTAADEG